MADKDPNVMTSTLFVFATKHWFVSVKIVALYAILNLLIAAFTVPTYVYYIISGISLAAFILFDYTDSWNVAVRDYNLVKLKYIEYDKYKGIKAGLMALIPGIFIVLLIYILKKWGGGDYLDVVKLVYFILYAPFVTITPIFEDNFPLIYCAPLVMIPIISQIGYYYGYRNIGVFQKLLYARKNDRSKNKKLR